MAELSTNEITLEDAAPVASGEACESCGAPVEALDRFCGACGAPHAGAPAVEAEAPAAASKYFRCENCGAEVATDPDQRSYTCPFCDSTYVVEYAPEQTGREPPEFVIGFAVTPAQAMERFKTWLAKGNLFRPGDLQSAQVAEKLKGVYLPFWSFSMLAQSSWSASIGEYWYRTETYTTTENGKTVTKTRRVRETEWWDLDGRHHRYYSGFLVSGSRGLPQQDAERIKPFHLAALKRYAPGYLAGWLSEEYSVEKEQAETVCRHEFHRWEERNIAEFLPGDTYRSLRTQTSFSNVNSDLILLPVYLLSYRYGDKLYRFMLNGQTGTAAGNKPLSWLRILLAVGSGVALIIAAVIVAALLGAFR